MATRTFVASAVLGAAGLTWALFVLTRILDAWQIGSAAGAHELSLFGARLSYPAANSAALVLAALAVLGLAVMVAASRAIARELLADRRLRHGLALATCGEEQRAMVVEGRSAQAFCAGLVRPRVYLTAGALELLDPSELAAVLAHERHHAERRDPLRLACGRVLADALFFLPGLRELVARQCGLTEIGADEAAVLAADGDRSALASAMLRFAGPSSFGAVGLDPERVDRLLGESRPPRFPLALCTGMAIVLAALVALAVLAAHGAAGTATLGLPFFSSAPCITVLAAIPICAIAAGVVFTRALTARRRHADRVTA
jgi:hypothetical protein